MGAGAPGGRAPAEKASGSREIEGWFAVDRDLRVVEWDEGAESLLGISRAEALGQACYQVVGGLDERGRPVCGPNCPVHRALRLGLPATSSPLVVRTRDGGLLRVTCQLFALPDPPGGTLGRLRPAAHRSSEVIHDLAVTSALSSQVPAASFQKSVDQALNFLLRVTGAEAGEVWVVEPGGRSVVFVSHQGQFHPAFTQMTRFAPGEGFPGVTLLARQPVCTDRLPEQPYVLRSRLRQSGLQSYVSVPLIGASGKIVGTIGVSFLERQVNFGRVLRLLGWVSSSLGLKVDATLAEFRESARDQFNRVVFGGEPDLRRALEWLLVEMVQLAGADGGELYLVGEGLVARHGLAEALAAPVEPAVKELLQPALPVPVGLPRSWQTRVSAGGAWCWIPLLANEGLMGVVLLYYGGRKQFPPEGMFGALEHFAAAVTESLCLLRPWLTRRGSGVGLARLPARTLVSPEGSGTLVLAGTSGGHPNGGNGRASARLEVRCLGPFELVIDGKLITPAMVSRKKAVTLLKILLAYNGRPQPKEALIELLWPGADPETKASQFHVLVHELRTLIEPGGRDQRWTYVCNDGDRYYFNIQSGAFIDAREFARLCEQGRWAEARGDWEQAMAAYQQAVELYRGDYFEDEPYADWCWHERERLREMCVDALVRLAEMCARTANWEEAIRYLRRALELDPVREDLHSKLMYALWATGRRAEAVRQYQTCARILSEKLGLSPLPETQELLQKIQASPYPDGSDSRP